MSTVVKVLIMGTGPGDAHTQLEESGQMAGDEKQDSSEIGVGMVWKMGVAMVWKRGVGRVRKMRQGCIENEERKCMENAARKCMEKGGRNYQEVYQKRL